MKMFSKRLVAIWMTLCLLSLSVFALAAPSQNLMDYLADEGIDTSDESAMAHVYTVGDAKEALGVALTLEGMYFDGESLYIGWRTENLRPEEPVLVLYTDVTINGESIRADADHPVSYWWPRMFGLFVAGDPINNLMGRFLVEDTSDYDLQGEAEVSAHFTVMRPTKPLVIIDPEIHVPYDIEDMETDRLAMIEAMQAYGVTIAEPEDTDVAAWQDKGYQVVNRNGEHYLADESEGRAALTGADFPDVETEDVVLSFTVDLDALAGR